MNAVVAPASRLAAPRAWLPWVGLVLALIALFWDTAASMVSIWIRSETYTHAFVVPLISAWLVWRRREALAGLPVAPVPWMLLAVAGACLLWLAGQLASVQAATHTALVALIVLSVPAVLGWAVTREVLFPLLFLFFAVPFGEFMVPQLMDWTATFTVLALQWTGIPVYRDGLQFVIPSGNWSVVEACSGIRYLMASFMVGTLFAYLNYTSTRRRAAFMLVSLVVPLVANWMRAYMIVMLGHLSNNKIAAGADHLIYGWVFFGIVIALMFMIGARWAEDGTAEADRVTQMHQTPAAAGRGRPGWVIGAMLALVLGTQLYGTHGMRLQADAELALRLPPKLPQDWVAGKQTALEWRPAFTPPSGQVQGVYARDGRQVGVWIGYYRLQGGEGKLVTSANQMVDREERRWSQVAQDTIRFPIDAGAVTWRTYQLREADPLKSTEASSLAVWQIYWTGRRWLHGDVPTKLWAAWDRLRGRSGDGAVVMIYTRPTPGYDVALTDVARGMLPLLDDMLDRAGKADAP